MTVAPTRTLRPLRSCASAALRSLYRTADAPPRWGYRAVSSWKPAANPSRSAPSTRTVASKRTAAAAPKAASPTPGSSTAAPATPETPSTPLLDPQAALTPAETASPTSSFAPVPDPAGDGTIDWSASFHGLGQTPYSPETAAILMAPLDPEDVEVKPDGIIYLPEIKYRRILNRAFGPGGWGLAPRGELTVGEKMVTREYALIAHGRFVGQARGECQYFSDATIPTAGEGCKSNALMRCCKDLGIGSELWDPRFIRNFKKQYAQEIWVEHVMTKKKRQIWIRKDGEVSYPYKRV